MVLPPHVIVPIADEVILHFSHQCFLCIFFGMHTLQVCILYFYVNNTPVVTQSSLIDHKYALLKRTFLLA